MIQKMQLLLFAFCLFGFSFAQAQQTVTVTGVVTDSATGDPITGVNIVEKGTTKGDISDIDGKYSITVNSNGTLQFSYVGYATQAVAVNGRSVINVKLASQEEGLDEVVIVGYGTQKKGNLTGAVSTIDSEVLESRPVNNTMQALQGAAPGLTLSVNSAGGEPGAGMSISIRGVGNLQGTGAPLVIVDDIPLSDPSRLNDINPDDIEDISVLKDAASSAIYGSRAAFGVIIVKTKSGEGVAGHKVTYSNNFIYSSPLNRPDMLNSLEFANYFNLAATNGGGAPIFSDEVLGRIKAYLADPETPL